MITEVERSREIPRAYLHARWWAAVDADRAVHALVGNGAAGRVALVGGNVRDSVFGQELGEVLREAGADRREVLALGGVSRAGRESRNARCAASASMASLI